MTLQVKKAMLRRSSLEMKAMDMPVEPAVEDLALLVMLLTLG